MNTPDATALQRLDRLQQLASQQEDRAARQLADALAKHANAQDRHAELLHYEMEYTGRSTGTASDAQPVASVMGLRHHAGFLSKLREAIGFQGERVAALAAEVERARSRWIGLHREVEKLEQLGHVARRQRAVVDARRQSRELDELAQQGWARQQAVS